MFQSVPQSLEYQQSSWLEHVPYKQHFLLFCYTMTWTIRKLTWESLCCWEYCWWCSTRGGWCRWGWCGEECSQLSSSPSSYEEPDHRTYWYHNHIITHSHTWVYPFMVQTGLVVPSSSWSLRSPADISIAVDNHLSCRSVSDGCLVLGLLLTPPFNQVSMLALGSLHLLWCPLIHRWEVAWF